MAQARAAMRNQYGNMITYHDETNTADRRQRPDTYITYHDETNTADRRLRDTDTFKSNIQHKEPINGLLRQSAQAQRAREERFTTENPLRHAPTRQTYQDSDIFRNRGEGD